jgi:SynChlorMet cassette protein ScmD
MKASDKPIINPAVVLREETDEWAILFNADTGDAIGINPVGVQIWKLMNGRADMQTIARRLKRRFSDVPEDYMKQVLTFVEDLAENGFVAVEEGSVSS